MAKRLDYLFINFTNHASSKWSEKQRESALDLMYTNDPNADKEADKSKQCLL